MGGCIRNSLVWIPLLSRHSSNYLSMTFVPKPSKKGLQTKLEKNWVDVVTLAGCSQKTLSLLLASVYWPGGCVVTDTSSGSDSSTDQVQRPQFQLHLKLEWRTIANLEEDQEPRRTVRISLSDCFASLFFKVDFSREHLIFWFSVEFCCSFLTQFNWICILRHCCHHRFKQASTCALMHWAYFEFCLHCGGVFKRDLSIKILIDSCSSVPMWELQ